MQTVQVSGKGTCTRGYCLTGATQNLLWGTTSHKMLSCHSCQPVWEVAQYGAGGRYGHLGIRDPHPPLSVYGTHRAPAH